MDQEPVIITYGRNFIREYPETELREALVRAFRDGRADSVVLDSNARGQRFTSASAAWAIDNGLLYHDLKGGGEQCEVYTFRLTEKGREEILGRPA